MDLNKFGKRAYDCAMKRGKIRERSNIGHVHHDTHESLVEEVEEFMLAGESEPSEHIGKYSAVAEELADVAIVTFTELYRRGVDIEAILKDKMEYNECR